MITLYILLSIVHNCSWFKDLSIQVSIFIAGLRPRQPNVKAEKNQSGFQSGPEIVRLAAVSARYSQSTLAGFSQICPKIQNCKIWISPSIKAERGT